MKRILLLGTIAVGMGLLFKGAVAWRTVLAQQELIVVEPNGGECEINSLHMNQLRRQAASTDSPVFVIARLGDGETSRNLNHRRLNNVRVILGSNNVVAAEGERVKGPGRIEIYMGCKLVLVSKIRRGRDICLTCCDPEKELYPWLKPKRS